MDIKKILVNMGMLGLLLFSIMAFIVINQTNNNVIDPITNNDIINETYSDLQNELASTGSQSESSLDNFGKIPPTQQYGELEVTSIVNPTSTAKTIILGFWNIFIKLPQSILGVSPEVASLISSILIIFIIIGIWAVWKGVVT